MEIASQMPLALETHILFHRRTLRGSTESFTIKSLHHSRGCSATACAQVHQAFANICGCCPEPVAALGLTPYAKGGNRF